MTQALARVRKAAQQRRKEKFTALFHHLSVDLLREAFLVLKRDAAPGMDGLTWQVYAADLERNLTDLHARVHRGAYRATPSRRTYIPKADGRRRPLAVAALEDKIVQRATVAVLNCIYEEEFFGFSYGFRPKRGQHDALDALVVGITDKKVNFILDADVRSFFDEVSQHWLIHFVEHRVGDPRIIRLIQKWLKVGVLEDGVVAVSDKGTGQGSVISPLLANVYLHYVFDLWAERWRRREATGGMMIVRYADDIVVGFAHEVDARRFWDAMRKRFEEFALSLHPEKTRLIEFGRQAADRRDRRGLGKPETFNFLGFTHICGRSRHGKFLLKRKSRRDRMRGKLKEIKEEMRRRMHQSIPEQGRWLAQVVRGYFAYHAVPTNSAAIGAFRHPVVDLWRCSLSRRSQRGGITWQRIKQIADDWLPQPRILHPWPQQRFAVRYSR
ncbi:MAG: group II intron reverse transcriptase/maturase [Xanthobacteraceae bacterium]